MLGAAELLTIDQALRLAEENHPSLREADAQMALATAGITTARAYPNPIFDITAARQNARVLGAIPGAYQYYVFAQPIDLPSVRQPRIEAAEIGRESTELARAEVRLLVRTSVRHAFYESLRWEGAIEFARESVRLIEDLRRRVQVRVDVGEAGRLELVRADAEVVTARSVANRAQIQLVAALSALRAATGAAPDADLNPEGALETAPGLPSIEALRTEVLDEYPALAQARAEIRRAESVLQTELALRKPQPLARFEWERLPDTTLYRFGLAFPVPLWNRREGPVGEAEAVLRRARASLDRQTVEIRAALERAYGQYQIATQQVSAYEGGALLEAEEALRSSEAAYQLGERGILEVLDAQRVLRTVRLDFLNAQFDRQAALTDLRHLRALDLRNIP